MSRAATDGQFETLELPGRMHPVLAVLAFLPIAVILLTILALVFEPQPILLTVILTVVMASCAVISWQAFAILLGGEVQFMPDGLKVKRLFQEEVYPWGAIEACKVMPATGTLGDNAFADAEDRVGVGLFVRGLDRIRDHDLDADVVLCAGDRDNVQAMMRIAQRVQKAVERAEAQSRRRPARAMPAAQSAGRPLRQKRPAQAAAKRPKQAANVVSQFRAGADRD